MKGENTSSPFLEAVKKQFGMLRSAQNFLHIAEPSSLGGNIHLLGEQKGKRKGPLFILLLHSKTQVSRKCLWSSPVEKVATEIAAVTWSPKHARCLKLVRCVYMVGSPCGH